MSLSTICADDPQPGLADFAAATAGDTPTSARPWQALTRCPACGGPLAFATDYVCCQRDACGRQYPISRGVPVLVDEDKSVFSIEAFLASQPTFFKPVSRWRGLVSRVLPTIDLNVTAKKNFANFKRELINRFGTARVLVIGGGILGTGMECLLDDPNIELVETDASVGPRTQMICDAHDLPFADGSFQGVIVQAVLEHVLDPWRVVQEIHRVLVPGGMVYSDTPFIAQVHGREFDFHRFTRLGHRRLFRHFAELDSGITGGPMVATLWTLRYLALSCFESRPLRAAASAAARVLLFPFKYLDYWLIKRRGALDAAMAFYFLGTKATRPIEDQQLLASYKGGF
jgi:SAM-dependent methyltransferase